jgi:hypothetical protein
VKQLLFQPWWWNGPLHLSTTVTKLFKFCRRICHSHRFLKILILTDASLAAPRAPINWRRLTRIVGVVVEMESEEISQSAFKLALGEVKVAVAMR